MSKYIDADRLIRRLENRTYKAVPNFIKMINEQEAADVVEVVRCRECRYREEEQPGMVYCPNTVGGWVDENWFCAGGERE